MRPKKCRRVDLTPGACVYKPAGIPLHSMVSVEIGLDELEAIRFVDSQGMYQEEACRKMEISRSTLARILESGRKKIADALVNGHAIIIRGS